MQLPGRRCKKPIPRVFKAAVLQSVVFSSWPSEVRTCSRICLCSVYKHQSFLGGAALRTLLSRPLSVRQSCRSTWMCWGAEALKQKPHVRLTSTALESTGIASAPVFMTLPHSFVPSLCLQPLEREGSESDLLNCPQSCLPIQPWEQFLSISINCHMLPPGCPHSLPTCAEAHLNLPPPPTASSSRGQAPALRRSTCGWRCDRLLARTPLLFLSASALVCVYQMSFLLSR